MFTKSLNATPALRIVGGAKKNSIPDAIQTSIAKLPPQLQFDHYGGGTIQWALHAFDIPSFEFCISGYSPSLVTERPPSPAHLPRWGIRKDPVAASTTASEFARPPSVAELREIVMGISDEEALKAQIGLKTAVMVHLPRDLVETVLRYAWEPKDFVGSPITLCGVKHMFIKGEKERLCIGVSVANPKTGVLAYKTRTKLLVAALVMPSSYLPPMAWSAAMEKLETLEFDLQVANL